jgi:hypothetical protein
MCAPRAVPDFTCFAHKMHAIAQLQPAILSKGPPTSFSGAMAASAFSFIILPFFTSYLKIIVLLLSRNVRCSVWSFTAVASAWVSVSRPTATSISGV